MSDFHENCITLSHQDKKLEAVFIHQPITDANQSKEYENFVEQMRGVFQKFLESPCFSQAKQDKQTENAVDEIDPKKYADLYNSISPLAKEINSLKTIIKDAGGFVEDRELLECSGCGLVEDAIEGKWIVYTHR